MSKVWRFKTKEEFIRDGHWDAEKGTPVGWNSGKKMNYLMGQRIDSSLHGICQSHGVIGVESWKIGGSDYVCVDEEFVVTGTPEAPKFDFERLATEIDGMFQSKLVEAKSKHDVITRGFNTALESNFNTYKNKVHEIFPSIKDSLIAEIQRGHTTIVLPDHREIAITATDHPKLKDVILSLEMQRKAMLVGPAGTGKTYMIGQVADRLDLPFYKYSCSRDSSVHDLIGYKQPTSETYLETTFLKAYEQGGIFLVDEYDAMSGDMSLFFNGVADGSRFISIPHRDTAPIARKHKDFYLVMCGNTWGKGSIDYSGRDFQDMALMDRFRFCRHHIGYHFILEKEFMGRNYPFAQDLRKNLESLGSYLSTRNIEDLAKMINCRYTKDQIVLMISQDLSVEDQRKLANMMSSTTFYPGTTAR